MPYFTLPIQPQGPLVAAYIGVSRARRDALVAAGKPVPAAILIAGALIDTGASCTCVDKSVIVTLGLPPTGIASLYTPSTGTTPHNTSQYDVQLSIPGPTVGHPALNFSTVPVTESDFSAQGIQALIGRDILQHCVLTYVGGGFFTLAY